MGRVEMVKQYVRGFGAGVLQQSPSDDSSFRDGWAEGRLLIAQCLKSYLEQHGLDPLSPDLPISDFLGE